ncbi:flagellar biosynthetic protein FliO [Porticoccaceae bacterium]|nr:flagellar biosynthetic protein FliO [Porticoccaceae bacterium]
MAAEYGWAEWLSMIASFLLVMALLVGTLFALKKLGPTVTGAGKRRLSILEVQNLGARQKLLLVSVNGEQILVGLSPQGMTRLGGWQVDEEPLIEEPQSEDQKQNKIQNFKQLFSHMAKRQKD